MSKKIKISKKVYETVFSFKIDGTIARPIVPIPPIPPGIPEDKPIPPLPIILPVPEIGASEPVRVVWGWSWIHYYIDFPDYPGGPSKGDSSSWVTGYSPETDRGTMTGTANAWSKAGDGSIICDVTIIQSNDSYSYNIDESSPCWPGRPPGQEPAGSYWPSWDRYGEWGRFLDWFGQPVLSESSSDGGDTGWISYSVAVANVLYVIKPE